jgi:hypothetical protein
MRTVDKTLFRGLADSLFFLETSGPPEHRYQPVAANGARLYAASIRCMLNPKRSAGFQAAFRVD